MAQEKYKFTIPFYDDEDIYYNRLKEKSAEREIDDIFKMYREGELISTIKNKFPYFSGSAFHEQLPFILSDEKCEKCNGSVYFQISRKKRTREILVIKKICDHCGHRFLTSCNCEYCMKKREKEEKARRREFENNLQSFIEENYTVKLELSDIDIYDEIRIGFFSHYCLEHGIFKFPQPDFYSDFWDWELASNEADYIEDIIEVLNKQLVRPSPHSPITEPTKLEYPQDTFKQDDISKWNWELNIYRDGKRMDTGEFKTHFSNRTFTDMEKSTLWRIIYKTEVHNCANYILAKYAKFEIDSIISDYITNLVIEHASLSQVYAMLNSATNSILRLKARKKNNRQSLKSVLVNKMETYAERSKNQNPFAEYNRPNDLETDFITRFILSDVLDLKINYFYLPTHTAVENYQSLE